MQKLFAIAVVLLATFGAAAALKCYACSTATSGTSCSDDKVEENVIASTCTSGQTYCVKEIQAEVTTRSCATTCTKTDTSTLKRYCCTADNCNSASFVGVSGVIVGVLAALAAGLVRSA